MQQKTLRLSLVFLSFLVIFQPLTALGAKIALPEGTLSRLQVKKLILWQTVEAVNLKGKQPRLIYFGPNGELRQVREQKLELGRWEVTKKGRLCLEVENRNRECRILVPGPGDYRLYQVKKSASHIHTLTFVTFHPGDKLVELTKGPILPRGTLGEKAVKKLFRKKTVESVTANKGRVSLTYYGPKGKVIQERNGQHRMGKWRVTNDGRICLQMENRKEKCRIIVKEGKVYKKYIVKKNGQHQHSVSYRRFIKGNQLK